MCIRDRPKPSPPAAPRASGGGGVLLAPFAQSGAQRFSPAHPDYQAAMLPLLADGAALRPLCGAIPLAAGAALAPGHKVAANVSSEGDLETSWILATVISHVPTTRHYVVSDDDGAEGAAAQHSVHERAVVPLPTALPERFGAQHEFARSSRVLALWPDSTCFYNAVVGFPPSQRVRGPRARAGACPRAAVSHPSARASAPPQPERDYMVAFADDKDELGHPLLRRVPPKYVVQQRAASAE